MRVLAVLPLAALFLAPSPSAAAKIVLAHGGQPRAVLRLADDAIPAETTAARELLHYLQRITSASFEIEAENAPGNGTATIEIGPTRLSRELDPALPELGPEDWVIRSEGEHLFLYGGRPRGTLYAVYRFLEDHLGVRWWTPYEESVPRMRSLLVRVREERGRPGFASRDMYLVDGPRRFGARNRLNGYNSRLSQEYGGSERYGAQPTVHSFYAYVPPEEFFDTHPEYFSEIVGLRYGGRGQLCLTNEGLLDLVQSRLERDIEISRKAAERRGEPPPRLFDFSQNDWRGACTCGPCSELAAREGSESGPVIAFVNQLAGRIGKRYPDVMIRTLAYHYTLKPPRELQAADNVIVQVAALHRRDFAKPATHPANREYLDALRGWRDKVRHLRIWVYALIFGKQGEFPLPNLAVMAADLRLYQEMGVEGVFVENPKPVAGDLRDLKLWVLLKLLENPERDHRELVKEFTSGYYGPAAGAVRRYLDLLAKAAERKPSTIRFLAKPEAYAYLDRRFIVRAQRLFDDAERAVRRDPDLLRRVRHARLTLDRVTLSMWPLLAAEDPLPFDRTKIVRRYRETWHNQIEIRLREPARESAREDVEREIAGWDAALDE